MKNTHINSVQEQRIKRWTRLPSEVLEQLPKDDCSYMYSRVNELGRYKGAQARISKIETDRKECISERTENIIKLIVIVVGAFSLSLVPYTAAKNTGRGNALSTSSSLIFGGVASYAAHTLLSHYIAKEQMRKMTKDALLNIGDSETD